MAEGARVCHVTETTIRRWINKGWLVVSRETSGRYSFTLKALMDAELVARLARQRRLGKHVDLHCGDVL